MQPAGQSPQPTSNVTMYPSPVSEPVQEQHPPIGVGSTGPIAARAGYTSVTRAAASSTDVTGRGDGVGNEAPLGEPHAATATATRRMRIAGMPARLRIIGVRRSSHGHGSAQAGSRAETQSKAGGAG